MQVEQQTAKEDGIPPNGGKRELGGENEIRKKSKENALYFLVISKSSEENT